MLVVPAAQVSDWKGHTQVFNTATQRQCIVVEACLMTYIYFRGLHNETVIYIYTITIWMFFRETESMISGNTLEIKMIKNDLSLSGCYVYSKYLPCSSLQFTNVLSWTECKPLNDPL